MAGKTKSRKASAQRVNTVRNLILGLAAALVAGIAAWGFLYSTGGTSDGFAAGSDWTVIEDAPASGRAPLTVTEFFSYGCVHCRNFDPLIETWREGLPEDASFVRAPVSYSPVWALLAKTYLALELEEALPRNHERLFRAIHDQQRQFLSADQLADFVAGRGITRERFLATFNSSRVQRRLNEIDQLSRRASVRSVPSLIVANRYLVNMDGGRKRALEIANHLLDLERAARNPA
ncbi:MAG: thiol:disulfide interchange protein DsbA/DsbL [Pseudomonadota bacterium]